MLKTYINLFCSKMGYVARCNLWESLTGRCQNPDRTACESLVTRKKGKKMKKSKKLDEIPLKLAKQGSNYVIFNSIWQVIKFRSFRSHNFLDRRLRTSPFPACPCRNTPR